MTKEQTHAVALMRYSVIAPLISGLQDSFSSHEAFFRDARVIEISVRDNELYSFTRQHKIDHATNITGEIATEAYRIFKENYDWRKPIRSVGVRGADLVNDNYWEQIDLFSSVEQREKQMKLDEAVDTIRRRFGFYSVQRGLMYRDKILSSVNAKEDHTTHPIGYFG